MSETFLFNSTPRSGNVFLTFLFSMFVKGHSNKCLDIEKYSDTSQKQAAFFRNPYDSIPSTVVKSRVDCGTPINHDDPGDLMNNINVCAREYLKAIRTAKANQSNLYIGKSEDMMADPIGTIKDIALFFGLEITNSQVSDNEQVVQEIKKRMTNTQKTRVDQEGITIIENLMTNHDGHMPRDKSEDRVFLDNLIQEVDSNIVTECYNEYISIKSTNAKEGQRWVS